MLNARSQLIYIQAAQKVYTTQNKKQFVSAFIIMSNLKICWSIIRLKKADTQITVKAFFFPSSAVKLLLTHEQSEIYISPVFGRKILLSAFQTCINQSNPSGICAQF